jgi:hypothetical protein
METVKGDTLYRGTESGTKGAATRVSPDGEMGPGNYASPSMSIASSYGGGPKASVKAGTRTVHALPIGPLKPEDIGYVWKGYKPGAGDAMLIGHNGDLLHSYDALGNTPEAKASRAEMVKVAKQHGIKMIVGHDDSIAHNQVNILDQSVVKNP